MTRKNLLIVFWFCILFLTGCGTQTLTCTKHEDTEAGKASEKQVITFNNDKIKLYTAEMKINLNNDYKEYSKALLKSIQDPFEEYKNADGVKYTTSEKNGNILFSVSGDYTKMDDEAKKSFGIDKNLSFNDIKENLENDGYTCQ